MCYSISVVSLYPSSALYPTISIMCSTMSELCAIFFHGPHYAEAVHYILPLASLYPRYGLCLTIGTTVS